MTKSIVTQVGVHEAKTRLSELLRRIDAGEEVEILRNGVPVARLVPTGRRGRRTFGHDHGVLVVPDDFDAPLDPGELDRFES